MAGRKAQHDAEYFPFFAKDGRTLFMLQTKFELEGIGFFTNLMRLLCTTPHHFLDLQDPIEALYMWSKIGIKDEAKAEAMIGLMVSTGKLDRDLWEKRRVIYCQQFVDSLAELYAKRKEKPLPVEAIRLKVGISGPEIPISAPEMTSDSDLTAFPGAEIRKGEEGEKRREEFAQSENPDRENLDPPENTEEAPLSTPPDDFDPIASLVMPKGVKFTQKELRELYQDVGENAQKHLDRYALAKQAKDFGYRNDWAGLRYFWDRAGGAQAWLAGTPQGQQGSDLSARQELASKPLRPREATTLDQGVEQGKATLAGMSARDFTRRSTA